MQHTVENMQVLNESAWNNSTICGKKISKNCTEKNIEAIWVNKRAFYRVFNKQLVKFILFLAAGILKEEKSTIKS
jgi:hypothetical protein